VIYNLRHKTTYAYDNAVAFARCVLRLTPLSSARQTVLESAIHVTPSPSRSISRKGPFGEQTRTVTIEQPHRKLIIEATSRVDVHSPPLPDAAKSLPWEAIRTLSLESESVDADSPATFIYPTSRAPILGQITDYARPCFTRGRPVIEACAHLMANIYKDFTYDSDATTVSTPASEAFAARRGVCQDFAHIMISGLRGLGLPAAYVSGYLRTTPPPGRPRLEGADATHAWAQVWCGEKDGWIGFDPTNAIMVQDDHIVLAVGRDYGDVAPIDGIMLSPGKQTLKVEVDVIPQDELDAKAKATPVPKAVY
jgi:transglutaminase-like putative cysteine protease